MDDNLPPLPEPDGVIVVGTQAMRAFTAETVQAYARAALSAQEVGRDAMPKGWRLETGVGGFGEKGTRWVCVRNLESQCGQDFYEDRDPLIFNFLWALAAIAKDTQ